VSFGAAAWLLVWVIVGALAVAVARARSRSSARWQAALGEALRARLLPDAVRRRRVQREWMATAGLVLCVLALAEPRFGKEVQTLRATGSDVVVVLDLSRSMDAADVEPSRLVRAKREVADLLAMMQGDRVALVVFAGGAFPHVPLTADTLMVERVVEEVSSTTFQGQGSAIGAGLRAAAGLLGRTTSEAGKAVVLLSDGEDHDPDDARAAADELAAARIPVFALAVGDDSAPVPAPDGGYIEEGGTRVTSTPDPDLLGDLARRSGGAFARSVASDADMRGLYAELRRSVEVVEREVTQRETWRTAFQVPLALGMVLLFLSAALGDGRAVAAVLALLVAMPASAADRGQAERLYRDGHFDAAAAQWEDLQLEAPRSADVAERLAAARYRAGDFEGAARAYEAAWRAGGDGDTLFGAGNAQWRAGRLEEALRRFDAVLRQDPDRADARRNRDLLAAEIEARRQAQPPPPPPPPEGEEGDEEQPQGGEQPPPGEGGQPPPDGAPSEGDPSPEPGEEGGQPDGTEGGEEPQPAGEADPTEGSQGEGTPVEMTAAQADRLLDAVEEGHLPITVGSGEGARPW
jgi:Ca-activated chloride channel family protein